MRLAVVTGLEVPGPGSGVFQTMFFSEDHWAGKPVSELVPSPFGPRNSLQSAPRAEQTPKTKSKTTGRRWRCIVRTPPVRYMLDPFLFYSGNLPMGRPWNFWQRGHLFLATP